MQYKSQFIRSGNFTLRQNASPNPHRRVSPIRARQLSRTAVAAILFSCLPHLSVSANDALQEHVNALRWHGARITKDDSGRIVAVDCSSTTITDRDLEHLKAFSHLKRLNISSTAVMGPGLKVLNDLSQLRVLEMEDTPGIDEFLEPLSRLERLEVLDLRTFVTTNDGVVWVGQLPHLRELLLPNRLSDEGMKHLRNLKELDVLDLSQTDVGDNGLQVLENLTTLRELVLPRKATDKGLKYLKNLKELWNLDMSLTQATGAELQYLPNPSALRVLRLPKESHARLRIFFTDKGAVSLEFSGEGKGFESIAKMKNLSLLEIGNTVTEADSHKLRSVLPESCRIERYPNSPPAPDEFPPLPTSDSLPAVPPIDLDSLRQ